MFFGGIFLFFYFFFSDLMMKGTGREKNGVGDPTFFRQGKLEPYRCSPSRVVDRIPSARFALRLPRASIISTMSTLIAVFWPDKRAAARKGPIFVSVAQQILRQNYQPKKSRAVERPGPAQRDTERLGFRTRSAPQEPEAQPHLCYGPITKALSSPSRP